MRGQSKYSVLLDDAHVKRWFKNLARGSPITAEVALRRLSRLCELLNTTPQGMVDRAKRNLTEFQDMLEDMVAELEAERKAPGYIADLMKTVRSWLRYNEVTLTRKIKISNSSATPTIEDEQVPSQEELARIFRVSPSRIRVAEALMAFTVLRPETLGNYDGSDGLRLKDLPELRIENGQIIFDKIPTIMIIRSNLSKTGHKYFTFLSSEGCTYLKEYLEERVRSGEELTIETPLIAHERKDVASKRFVQTRKITHFIRQCMRRTGVFKRPYVLRAYAETQLIIAESKGRISHPYLQFIAGHKGDIEARYSTNKGVLPPGMIEDMRKCYSECEPFLSTMAQPLERLSVIKLAS